MGETEKVPGIIFLSQRVRAPHRIGFDHGERCLEPVPSDIEQAQVSEHGGNYESTEGIGGGVGAMIEGQTVLAEEIQR